MNNALLAIERAKQRLAEIKKAQELEKQQKIENINNLLQKPTAPNMVEQGLKIDKSVVWNEEQQQAINMALSGKSFCLIGAAGTGKTTTIKGVIRSLIDNGMLPPIPSGHSTKWLTAGNPGVCLVSFTNMAVRQLAKHFSSDIHCVTIHKLLEFIPNFYEVMNDEGKLVRKVEFIPSRNKGNPLPRSLKTVVVDESSMVDQDLFAKLVNALPDPNQVQFIFLGDLNQLPPVYGKPILGKKLLELPTVELTQVYRQALESPIIDLAIKIKDGKGLPVTEKTIIDKGHQGKLTIHPWSKLITAEDALYKAASFLKAAIRENVIDPYQDIILCPHNVGFGTLELNKEIADYLGRQRNATVYEVIAGFNKHYLAVGDKVLVKKREAIIRHIAKNHEYTGHAPTSPLHYTITRWGGTTKLSKTTENADYDIDSFLDKLEINKDVEDRVHAASHSITVQFIDSHSGDPDLVPEDDRELETLSSAAEVNDMLFGYVITVHKSQGSEWRKVFFITHHSHTKMCSRELLYTGVTRAKEELYIICEPDRGLKAGTITKAAKTPRLKGNTLAEKLAALKEIFDRDDKESQES